MEPLLAEAVGRLLPADAGVYGAFPRQRDDNYVHTTFTDEFYTVLGGGLSVQHPGMTARVCSLGQVREGSRPADLHRRCGQALGVSKSCLAWADGIRALTVSQLGRNTQPTFHCSGRKWKALTLHAPVVLPSHHRAWRALTQREPRVMPFPVFQVQSSTQPGLNGYLTSAVDLQLGLPPDHTVATHLELPGGSLVQAGGRDAYATALREVLALAADLSPEHISVVLVTRGVLQVGAPPFPHPPQPLGVLCGFRSVGPHKRHAWATSLPWCWRDAHEACIPPLKSWRDISTLAHGRLGRGARADRRNATCLWAIRFRAVCHFAAV